MYTIDTIEYHRAEMARHIEDNASRYDMDGSDCALSRCITSSWKNFHELAINALEAGARLGIDGPAHEFSAIFDASGVEIRATMIVDGYDNLQWDMGAEGQRRFGRRWIPVGEKSRIQKALGITQRRIMAPASREVIADCASIGGGTNYILTRAR